MKVMRIIHMTPHGVPMTSSTHPFVGGVHTLELGLLGRLQFWIVDEGTEEDKKKKKAV